MPSDVTWRQAYTDLARTTPAGDGDAVRSWGDTPGNYATNTTSGALPIYRSGVGSGPNGTDEPSHIEFDGIDDHLLLPSTRSATDFTFVCAARVFSEGYIFAHSLGVRLGAPASSAGGNERMAYFPGDAASSAGPTPATDWNVYGIRRSGTSGTFWQGTQQIGTFSFASGSLDIMSAFCRRNSGSVGTYLRAKVAEARLWTSALSDGDMAAEMASLASALSLPAYQSATVSTNTAQLGWDFAYLDDTIVAIAGNRLSHPVRNAQNHGGMSIQFAGDEVYIHRVRFGGDVQYSIDGGAWTTLPTTPAIAWLRVFRGGAPDTTHTLRVRGVGDHAYRAARHTVARVYGSAPSVGYYDAAYQGQGTALDLRNDVGTNAATAYCHMLGAGTSWATNLASTALSRSFVSIVDDPIGPPHLQRIFAGFRFRAAGPRLMIGGIHYGSSWTAFWWDDHGRLHRRTGLAPATSSPEWLYCVIDGLPATMTDIYLHVDLRGFSTGSPVIQVQTIIAQGGIDKTNPLPERRKRWLVIGDSLTWGNWSYDVRYTNPANVAAYGQGYLEPSKSIPIQLAHYYGREPVHCGYGGTTISDNGSGGTNTAWAAPHLRARMGRANGTNVSQVHNIGLSNGANFQPEACILIGGYNDRNTAVSRADFESDLIDLLNDCQTTYDTLRADTTFRIFVLDIPHHATNAFRDYIDNVVNGSHRSSLNDPSRIHYVSGIAAQIGYSSSNQAVRPVAETGPGTNTDTVHLSLDIATRFAEACRATFGQYYQGPVTLDSSGGMFLVL